MARTISDIQTSIKAAVAADGTLGPILTSTSNVAVWNLWTYVVAFCQWTMEKLFDLHVDEVNNLIANQKPHTLQWYVTMAKKFQYGDALEIDSDFYPVTDPAKQIVNYAAATELFKGIRLKLAKTSAGDLAPLDDAELTAFKAYMSLVRDAGVRLFITSNIADSIKLYLKIYYNALVLDGSGKRLDGTNDTPIQLAIDAFLKNLPFNGLYINYRLLNALAAVDGVIVPEIVSAEATYGALLYTSIESEYQPDSGYLRIINPTDLTLEFTPHVPV